MLFAEMFFYLFLVSILVLNLNLILILDVACLSFLSVLPVRPFFY